METILGPNPRVAIVCRGGPENGPFSAMAARLITEGLAKHGIDVSAIYASSGSVPTALLGCTGDYPKLCDKWANATPEKIVGKISKIKTIMRLLRKESILTSRALKELITGSWDLDKIFSYGATSIKFPTVDLLSSEYIIFSNKNPKHKRWFSEGVLGSMGLVPFLQPQMVFDPVEADLISKDKVRLNSMLLIDGGFKGNILLEEAMRDNFNVIFLIDIHGLKPTETDLSMKYRWTNLIRSAFHILSNANDIKQYQLTDRANEEIAIRDELVELSRQLPQEHTKPLIDIITRMNNGRLRLGDKQEAKIYVVSEEEESMLFNFSNFEQETVLKLLSAGESAGNRVLSELGLS